MSGLLKGMKDQFTIRSFLLQTLFEWANASSVSTLISLHDLLDFCTFTAS